LPLLGRWTCKACGRRLSFWCSVSSSLKHNPLTWNLRKIYRYTHYIPRHPMTVAAWLRFSQCDRSELPMEVFFPAHVRLGVPFGGFAILPSSVWEMAGTCWHIS
jgi:hypothetical protein